MDRLFWIICRIFAACSENDRCAAAGRWTENIWRLLTDAEGSDARLTARFAKFKLSRDGAIGT